MKNWVGLFVYVLCMYACSSKKESVDVPLNDNRLFLIVGSYSDGTTAGISVYDFEMQTGDFEYVSDVKNILNPSYLVVSPDEKFVYSTNEIEDGAVSSFTFDKKTGTLSLINYQFTEGADPCYININKEATFIVTANYTDGSISVFPLTENGSISPLSQHIAFSSPEEYALPHPHAHTAIFSPNEKYLFVTDLGRDRIYQFDVADGRRKIYLNQEKDHTVLLKAGSGPRHLVFHPNGCFLYSINELSGTIAVFAYRDGIQHLVQYVDSDTASRAGQKASADIHLTPDGKFLYASNRSEANELAIFSVNSNDGQLTNIGYQETGIHPRNFIISPNGKFLLCANRDSNNIQIFEIDTKSGLLHDTGKAISVDKPVCLKWITKEEL
ncbi:MAG: lactonase family protein [Candidatus Azobacteroides sp.]|nr:lactonase family protein [Candidatus Azobacteroides sp.]